MTKSLSTSVVPNRLLPLGRLTSPGLLAASSFPTSSVRLGFFTTFGFSRSPIWKNT